MATVFDGTVNRIRERVEDLEGEVFGPGGSAYTLHTRTAAVEDRLNGTAGTSVAGALVTATGGTTARSNAERAADGYRPADFGAVGDGVTDDTAALQLWLNAGSSTKRPLIGDGRTYRVSTTLTVGSNTTIHGKGMVLKPDAWDDRHLISAAGTNDANRVENISIEGVHVDGTNRTRDDDPDVGGITYFGDIYVAWAKNVSIRNVSFWRSHDGVSMSHTSDFVIDGVRATNMTAAVVNFFSGCQRGTISNVVGRQVSELFDLFNAEDLTFSNWSVDADGWAGVSEAFDLSTSRRITITNGVSRGMPTGIRIKTDTGLVPAPTVAWSDISISNVVLADVTTYGIQATSFEVGYGAWRRLRISGVTITSSTPGALGIKAGPAAVGLAVDLDIEGSYVNVPGNALQLVSVTGSRVSESTFISTAAQGLKADEGAFDGLSISGGYFEGGPGINDAAAQIAFGQRVSIRDATFKVPTGALGTALRVTHTKAPVIDGNSIAQSGRDGIYLSWTTADGPDFRGLATVRNNVIRDWGQQSASKGAINVNLGAAVVAPVEGLVIAGNVAHLSDAATANTQYGVMIAVAATTLARSRYSGNTVGGRVPNVSLGMNLIPADGVFDNIPPDQPAVYQGSGSPEGVVTAKIGSVYLRSDGGAATAVYAKSANASGSTGWMQVGTQAAARADSAAADVPTLVGHFNDLLAKLRTAGILAP